NLGFDQVLKFRAHVSKGTYIRSLARDLGIKLNSYGALEILKRTMIGNYKLEDAKTIDEVSVSDVILDYHLFSHVRQLELNDYMVKLVLNGVFLDHRQTLDHTPFVVTDLSHNMIAYYEKVSDHFEPKYFFKRLI